MEPDCIARNRMGESAGLTLRKVGGEGMLTGSWRAAAWIAACTSSAAPSMSQSRSNWMVTVVVPDELCELIEETPAMVENCDYSGVTTSLAIVWGSAPGRLAETEMVGKSTAGSSLTGNAA